MALLGDGQSSRLRSSPRHCRSRNEDGSDAWYPSSSPDRIRSRSRCHRVDADDASPARRTNHRQDRRRRGRRAPGFGRQGAGRKRHRCRRDPDPGRGPRWRHRADRGRRRRLRHRRRRTCRWRSAARHVEALRRSKISTGWPPSVFAAKRCRASAPFRRCRSAPARPRSTHASLLRVKFGEVADAGDGRRRPGHGRHGPRSLRQRPRSPQVPAASRGPRRATSSAPLPPTRPPTRAWPSS